LFHAPAHTKGVAASPGIHANAVVHNKSSQIFHGPYKLYASKFGTKWAFAMLAIRRKLLALEHPHADTLTLDSDVEFRTLVKWAENRKIRFYGRYTLNPKP
jgi:hypothetical protein